MEMLRKTFALAVRPSNPCQVIAVEEGESGYRPFGEPFESAIIAAAYADRINEKLGITPSERMALTVRSMFAGSRASATDFANARPLLAEYQSSTGGARNPDGVASR